MRPIRIVILVTAAVAAIALALMVRGLMAPKTTPVTPVSAPVEKPTARVLVAKRDLPIGSRLTAADMDWQAWPADGLNPTFVTDGAPPAVEEKGGGKVVKTAVKTAVSLAEGTDPMIAFQGALVKEPILAGEPMTARKVVRGGEGGYMAVVLTPGMRAFSIPVTTETGAGGFILPGDRVDVLQSRQADNNGQAKTFTTETVLRNVRVLAIDQATEPAKDAKSLVGAVATLEIPAEAVPVMSRTKAQGEISLALRSYADAGGGPQGAQAADDTHVRIFRAGKQTEVTVQ